MTNLDPKFLQNIDTRNLSWCLEYGRRQNVKVLRSMSRKVLADENSRFRNKRKTKMITFFDGRIITQREFRRKSSIMTGIFHKHALDQNFKGMLRLRLGLLDSGNWCYCMTMESPSLCSDFWRWCKLWAFNPTILAKCFPTWLYFISHVNFEDDREAVCVGRGDLSVGDKGSQCCWGRGVYGI